MPIGKSRKKKPAPGKTLRKTAKKKTTEKKSSKPKAAKKKIVKKKAAIKRKKTALLKTRAKSSAKPTLETKSYAVEPGPPPQGIPPVEEPARNETAIGTVTHYYSHLGVAVVQINISTLKTGDTIRILGHSTDITQVIESMEYEHQHVDQASAGQSVGLRINDHAREHDIVYLVR